MRLPKIVGEVWFNTKPLTHEDIEGKVILADFWTYSCVNCLRTLPFLRNWWEKYHDKDFLLIAIHTPEFEFEKDPKNVEKAIKDLKVTWPVVLDNNYVNWNNFANRFWPAKYLADRQGDIVYEHFGEGAYAETEKVIQSLLVKDSQTMPKIAAIKHLHGAVCFSPTPETYCGYLRGRLENPGGFKEDNVFDYQLPDQLPNNSTALAGKFLAKPEYLESEDTEARLYLNFRATEVNLVAAPVDKQAVVEITLDGKTPPRQIRGKDIQDNNKLVISESKMYNLLKAKDFLAGILGVTAQTGNFRAYVFTFSGCVD